MNNKTSDSLTNILIDAGTNEVEIIEFYIADQPFGINVQKLREIVMYVPENLSETPERHPSVLGILKVRDNLVPLIDLCKHLGKTPCEKEDIRKHVLICEFNDRVNAFLVDSVNVIHRISWDKLQTVPSYLADQHMRFTGSVHIDNNDILIVDMELIIDEIYPGSALSQAITLDEIPEPVKAKKTRQDVKLFFAEDSPMIRKGIIDLLNRSGYVNVTDFPDGQACLDAIMELKSSVEKSGDLSEHMNLLITDVEMPRLDGFSLCKAIKADPALKAVPVVIFSSLINDDNKHKCQEVGADDHMSKPKISELIAKIDELCLT